MKTINLFFALIILFVTINITCSESKNINWYVKNRINHYTKRALDMRNKKLQFMYDNSKRLNKMGFLEKGNSIEYSTEYNDPLITITTPLYGDTIKEEVIANLQKVPIQTLWLDPHTSMTILPEEFWLDGNSIRMSTKVTIDLNPEKLFTGTEAESEPV